MLSQSVSALAGALDARDPNTGGHSARVAALAVRVGREMGLGTDDLERLRIGSLFHDVGKVGVPDGILRKPGRLDREERMRMNAHPVLGAAIVGAVPELAGTLAVIRHHHEWYNGSGYPDRLIGDEIPLLARIAQVADAWDAMVASRPYRPQGLSPDEAVRELRAFAGIQFDPVVVEAFIRTMDPIPGEDRSKPSITGRSGTPSAGPRGGCSVASRPSGPGTGRVPRTPAGTT
jgi:putative nucleotidyltransferase with HDIG domain